MFSFFKSRNDSRPLDQYLVRYLAGTYRMNPDEIEKLRFATSSEKLAGDKVVMFRIFDPSLVNGSGETGVKTTYADLDSQRACLSFEGRFARNKTVTEIKDLRSVK